MARRTFEMSLILNKQGKVVPFITGETAFRQDAGVSHRRTLALRIIILITAALSSNMSNNASK